MIVSAGYFSSRRAPNFQSSHEIVVIGSRAVLLEPVTVSIRQRASQCLHVEMSIL